MEASSLLRPCLLSGITNAFDALVASPLVPYLIGLCVFVFLKLFERMAVYTFLFFAYMTRHNDRKISASFLQLGINRPQLEAFGALVIRLNQLNVLLSWVPPSLLSKLLTEKIAEYTGLFMAYAPMILTLIYGLWSNLSFASCYRIRNLQRYMPLSDACIFIERNEPRIQSISTSLTLSSPVLSFVMQIRARNEGSNACHIVNVNHDVGSDDDLWQRLGRAISCNASLESLVLDVNDDHDIGHFSQRVQNARALFRGLSQNKSVHHLALTFRENPLLMFDFLTHFVQHNRSLRDIHFDFRRPLLTEQSQMLSNAIGNAKLNSLDLANCFVDHESLNRIIPRCTGVERLIIQCNTHENYAAVAALIQDPHTALTSIRIYFQGSGLHPRSIIRCSPNDGFALIISSLNGNETLKCLEFRGGFDDYHGNFINLLCDVSSIESIHNSNHTLEKLEVFDFTPEMIRSCIVMNQNANKTQVIRQKIAEYYFRGDFDIAPFAKMSISLLPSVLGLIRGSDINRHSAIYQMLKCIPDLCDVTTRNARQPNETVERQKDDIGSILMLL